MASEISLYGCFDCVSNGSVGDGCAEGLKSVRCLASDMIHSGIEFTGLFLTNTIPTNGWPQTSIGEMVRHENSRLSRNRPRLKCTNNHPSFLELPVEVSLETTQQPNPLFIYLLAKNSHLSQFHPNLSNLLHHFYLFFGVILWTTKSKTHSSLINRHHHHALLRWISTKGWIEKEAHHFQYDKW